MIRLTEEREARGWSKAELARRARITDSNYCAIENGRREPFEPEKERLSEVLGVQAAKLFKEVDSDGN